MLQNMFFAHPSITQLFTNMFYVFFLSQLLLERNLTLFFLDEKKEKVYFGIN